MSAMQDIIDQVQALPALPDTALKLMKAVGDPRSTMEDVVEAIRYDQVVTADVLRLCNSAYFGLSRRVTSLYEALLCLGNVKVLQLVMSVHTNAVLARPQEGYGLAPGVLWKHSVGVALAASSIAAHLKLPDAPMAFTAGLLHDIGKVVLNSYVSREFREIVRIVSERRISFLEAEKQMLGFTHSEVGAQIAEKWSLPEPIVRCIRFHHDPQSVVPPDRLVDAVHVGDCVCLMLGIGIGDDGLSYRADNTVMQRCGLREPDLERLGLDVTTELHRVQELFAQGDRASPVGATAK